MSEYMLMTYYVKYLKEIRKVADSTVKHYLDALHYITNYLVKKGKLCQSIYEIQDINDLRAIRTYLYSDQDFMVLDKRGHQMYSAGLNNYFKFANGDGFSDTHNKIELLDMAVPAKERTKNSAFSWKRSSIIKIQSIKSAGYRCAISSLHKTFTSRSTGQPYMEGHHILPMKYQNKFDNSLDVYANIVCLCPICHRLLHYGIEDEKKEVLEKIYFERVERLAVSGIRISKTDFYNLSV